MDLSFWFRVVDAIADRLVRAGRQEVLTNAAQRAYGTDTSSRENWPWVSAEGATAPETLRRPDRCGAETLERDARDVSAEGITISGEKTEGAFGLGFWVMRRMPMSRAMGAGAKKGILWARF